MQFYKSSFVQLFVQCIFCLQKSGFWLFGTADAQEKHADKYR